MKDQLFIKAEDMEKKQINLAKLSPFELNTLVVKGECISQHINFLPQRKEDDDLGLNLPDNACYFRTPSGKEDSFDYNNHDLIMYFIWSQKINVTHDRSSGENAVTASSAYHPELGSITVHTDNPRKAVAVMMIIIHNRFDGCDDYFYDEKNDTHQKVEMRKISDIYDAFNNGDSLTDSECITLYKHFERLTEDSFALGERFKLAFLESNRCFLRLQEICKARELIK